MMDQFMKQENLDEMENSFVYCQKVLVKIRHKIINLILLLHAKNEVLMSETSILVNKK